VSIHLNSRNAATIEAIERLSVFLKMRDTAPWFRPLKEEPAVTVLLFDPPQLTIDHL
jgi:hypothetical protein